MKECICCTNKSYEGGFVGKLCVPCHQKLSTNMGISARLNGCDFEVKRDKINIWISDIKKRISSLNNVEYIKTHLFCGYYRYNEKCVARCSTDISSITHTIHFELFEYSYYTLLNQLKFLNLLEAEEIVDIRLVELILHTGIKSINIIFDNPLDFHKK